MKPLLRLSLVAVAVTAFSVLGCDPDRPQAPRAPVRAVEPAPAIEPAGDQPQEPASPEYLKAEAVLRDAQVALERVRVKKAAPVRPALADFEGLKGFTFAIASERDFVPVYASPSSGVVSFTLRESATADLLELEADHCQILFTSGAHKDATAYIFVADLPVKARAVLADYYLKTKDYEREADIYKDDLAEEAEARRKVEKAEVALRTTPKTLPVEVAQVKVEEPQAAAAAPAADPGQPPPVADTAGQPQVVEAPTPPAFQGDVGSSPIVRIPSSTPGKPVHVSGYHRKDGTYVRPYDRAAPGMGQGHSHSGHRRR